MAIYQGKFLKECLNHKDCRYQDYNDISPAMDCEHVYFHTKISEYTGAKIYIMPSLVTSRFYNLAIIVGFNFCSNIVFSSKVSNNINRCVLFNWS